MRPISLIWAMASAAALVQAVWSEDAFRRDWSVFSHGGVRRFDLADSQSLISSTDSNELLSIDINRNFTLNWKTDLVQQPGFRHVVAGQYVYTYAADSPKLLVWSADSGSLVKDINLEPFGKVLAVWPAGEGAVVSFEYATVEIAVDRPSRVFPSVVSSDLVFSYDQKARYFVFDRKTVVFAADDAPVVHTSGIDARKVREARGTEAVVDSTVVDVLSGNVLLKEKNVRLLAPGFYYSHNGPLKVFHGDKLVYTEPLEEFSRSVYSENHLVLSNADEHRVFDLTEFFVTPESASLKVYSLPATSPDDQVSVFGSVVIAVSVEGRSVHISALNEVSDKTATYTIGVNSRGLDFPKALLINKPESQQTLDSIHHLVDEITQNAFMTRWIKRTRRHLSELGRFVTSKALRTASDKIEIDNPFNFEKLLVYVDQGSLVAVDSIDGSVVWQTEVHDGVQDLLEFNQEVVVVYPKEVIVLNTRNGLVLETIQPEFAFDKVIKFRDGDEDVLVAKAGGQLKPFYEAPIDGHYFVEQDANSIRGYKVSNSKLVSTWEFKRPEILAVGQKPADSTTASAGIGLHDRSVLYKYSTQNHIAVVAKENGVYKLYLLNGVDGSIVYSLEHEQNFDEASLKVLLDDNWIIYSYFEQESQKQVFTVVDLFKGKNGLEHSVKSFIFPEKIAELSSSYSKLGITIKSIVALTVNGDLIEIPKYVLNSRRVADHVLTQNDYQDDFRMTPYHPVIPRNNFQVLNHQYTLKVSDKNFILIKPTSLESTSIVCLINDQNQFCSRLQPSSAYDILNEGFDKVKLVLTMVVVLAIYLVTNPWVFRKNLDDNWLYK